MTPDPAAATLAARALSASLTVADPERSLPWYLAAGFAEDRRWEREGVLRSISVRAGDVRILLNRDDGARGAERVKGEGFSLMITVDGSVDDVAALIRAAGAALDSEPAEMPWGGRAFRARDPDGFRFAFRSDP